MEIVVGIMLMITFMVMCAGVASSASNTAKDANEMWKAASKKSREYNKKKNDDKKEY